MLFVNAWSDISVQFGDIFKRNIKDVNNKTKRVSIFILNKHFKYERMDDLTLGWITVFVLDF